MRLNHDYVRDILLFIKEELNKKYQFICNNCRYK